MFDHAILKIRYENFFTRQTFKISNSGWKTPRIYVLVYKLYIAEVPMLVNNAVIKYAKLMSIKYIYIIYVFVLTNIFDILLFWKGLMTRSVAVSLFIATYFSQQKAKISQHEFVSECQVDTTTHKLLINTSIISLKITRNCPINGFCKTKDKKLYKILQ